jgi:endonuclease G, mitochondrial
MKTILLINLLISIFPIIKAQSADVLLPSEREREQVIHHKSYSLSYNSSYVLPSWMSYKVVKSEVNKFDKVKEKYQTDPQIHTRSSNKNDYKEGGYLMAQLACYLDLQNYPEWKEEAFYLSNIVPMKPAFYNFIWSKTEDLIRLWNAGTNGLYVICGPILADGPFPTLGDNKLSIPKRFYKIVYDPLNQKAIGFVFTNGSTSGKLKSYSMSVDKVEKETGIDFFQSLDNELENKIESEFNVNDWNFELIEK